MAEENEKTYWFVAFTGESPGKKVRGNLYVESDQQELSLEKLTDSIKKKYDTSVVVITFFHQISKKSFDEFKESLNKESLN